MLSFGCSDQYQELTLIDSGISSISRELSLQPQLTSLNLHCNSIERIENLHTLMNLKHLDLSSNQIKCIEGLEHLLNLRTLNLSCNLIKTVQGLASLQSLVNLNISYNNINNLSGFQAVHGPAYQLRRVDLQGNKISSLKSVVEAFSDCLSLRQLTLFYEGADNPVCAIKEFRVNVLTSLKQLQILDMCDRSGKPVSSDTDLSGTPGLDDFLAEMLASSSSDSMPLATPNIDKAINHFKHRLDAATSQNTVKSDSSDEIHSGSSSIHEADRLKRIEDQLVRLMSAQQKSTVNIQVPISSHKTDSDPPKRDTDLTDESEDGETPSGRDSNQVSSHSTSCTPGEQKGKYSGVKLNETPPNRRSLKSKQKTAQALDERKKDDLKTTCKHLMDDLSTERDRRVRAENAAKQLAERLKQLQVKAKIGDEQQDLAANGFNRLKESLLKERQEVKQLQMENMAIRDDLKETQSRLEQSIVAHRSALTAVKTFEESVARMESDKHKSAAHQTKLLHEAESRVAASHREIDILRVQAKENKNTMQQLQQLLASREQEHKKELESRYSLVGPEIRELLQKEASHVEALYRAQLSVQQEKIDNLNRQYVDLEDEFKIALHIEANRFDKQHEAVTRLSDDLEQSKHELTTLRNKDEKATQLVTELTVLVKEQKSKIAELVKTKHDTLHDQKDRIQTLEAHLEEARRRIIQFELLKQDNKRLQAQLEGQQSIIEGLRAERKLWGQELAQQGSSLAQDRGRLEAKIEALNHEVSYLKKQLEREVDAVKIKAKLIDDQTESIKHMKDALIEKDEQVKSARDDLLSVQKKLENQLCDEQQAYRDAQEMIEDLTNRKEELKLKLKDLQEELQTERDNQSKINNKWKEKSDLIGQLEKQVMEMKETWDQKEARISMEKDKALRAANLAIEKMRQMDDAFRKQYDTTQRSHQEEMRRVVMAKDSQIADMQKQVTEVETEMRQLLNDQEDTKRLAEERIRKMAQAFTEFQQQLS